MIDDSRTTVLAEIQAQIATFVADREWQKYHTIKNLSIAIGIEAAELMEITQWYTDDELQEISREDLARIRQELADVMIYCLALCNLTGINPIDAICEKLEHNNSRYPKELYKGRLKMEKHD